MPVVAEDVGFGGDGSLAVVSCDALCDFVVPEGVVDGFCCTVGVSRGFADGLCVAGEVVVVG